MFKCGRVGRIRRGSGKKLSECQHATGLGSKGNHPNGWHTTTNRSHMRSTDKRKREWTSSQLLVLLVVPPAMVKVYGPFLAVAEGASSWSWWYLLSKDKSNPRAARVRGIRSRGMQKL